MASVEPHAATGPKDVEPFRQALLRFQERAGLYAELPGAVQFLSGTLFRVRVTVARLGAARTLYRRDLPAARRSRDRCASSTLTIDQTGLERRLFDFSQNDPLAYGLSTVLMAVLLGWLSSLAFRRIE